MPERTAPLLRLLGEIKKALNRLTETISEYEQSKSAQKKPETDTVPKVEVGLPPEITEYCRSEQADRRIKNKRDKIRIRLEVTGILVALAIAYLTFRSLIVFNGQLIVMKQQTEISERPWLSVEPKPIRLIYVDEPGGEAGSLGT